MKDLHNREIDYMRISITDRCNLRCKYCMPLGCNMVTHDDVLTYDQILLVCEEAVKLGITKFKITGGEPLVRKNCADLIKSIYMIEGVTDVTLTTNGILLKDQLKELMDAGLKSVNISLDSLDKKLYEEITGFDKLDQVIESIEAALEAGLKVKVNSVLNSEDYEKNFMELIKLPMKYPLDLRFIEMMPIGYGAESYLVSNDELLAKVKERFNKVDLVQTKRGNGPAVYYKVDDFLGCIGFISAIHGKFCDKCNRIRMTSMGEVKGCLCFEKNVDMKDLIKAGDREGVRQGLTEAIMSKPEKHCFEELDNITELKKMAQIGG